MKTKQIPASKIILFANPSFSTPVLEKLIHSPLTNLCGLVTNYNSPLRAQAQQYQIPEFSLAEIKKQIQEKSLVADLFVVAAYGKILPSNLIYYPPLGTLNIHPSLLPQLRGPSPVQSAIIQGYRKTGVSIIEMDEELDHGPIAAQTEYQLEGNETAPQLSQILFELGAELLLDLLPHWKKFKEKGLKQTAMILTPKRGKIFLPPQEQKEEEVTWSKKFSRRDGKIDWKQPHEMIYRQIRAFLPWPGSWTTLSDLIKGLALNKSLKKEINPQKKVKLIKVRYEDGVLIPEKIQVEGKRIINWGDFVNGYLE